MNNLLAQLRIPGPNGSTQEIQAPSGIPTGGLSGGGGKILSFGITIFLVVCLLLALGFLLYGGLNWIMSQGDKTKVESARRTIIYAIIGLFVAFFSFFVVNFFGKAIGVDLFNVSL